MVDASPQPGSRTGGIFLAVVAVVATAVYLALPWGSHGQSVATDASIAVTCLIGGVMIAQTVARGGWRGVIWLSWGLLLVGGISALLFLAEILRPTGQAPQAAGALFLLVLFPLVELAIAEYRQHFEPGARRELGVDAILTAASLTAILYVMLRPPGAGPQISLTAAIFAILAATQLVAYTVPVLWLPNRTHITQALTFTALGAATAALGMAVVPAHHHGADMVGGPGLHPRARSYSLGSPLPTPSTARSATSPRRDVGRGRCSPASRSWPPVRHSPWWPSSTTTGASPTDSPR